MQFSQTLRKACGGGVVQASDLTLLLKHFRKAPADSDSGDDYELVDYDKFILFLRDG